MNPPVHPSSPPKPVPQAQEAAPAPRRARRLWWRVVSIAAVVAIAAYFVFHAKTLPPASPQGFSRMAFRNIPVTLAKVTTGEINIYLAALGLVTPLNTITVRSRVDGELTKINFAEGQVVQQGDPLADIDPRSYQVALEQAQGQLARDRALLENAKRDLDRYQNAREAVTQQQIDTASATVAEYSGAVQADQGAVDNDNLLISYCHITAPISGRVGLKLVDQGNLVRAGDSTGIVVITQEQPIAVTFGVPEDSIPAVQKARAGGKPIPVEAFDRSMKNSLAKGELAAVDNQIDVATGTVRIKALFKNEQLSLFPNQFVNIRLLVEQRRDVVLVPTAAVQINGAARFVFVVKSDSSVERRNVTVGESEGEKTAVISGVASGETVVTEGLDRLQDGSNVTARQEDLPAGPAGAAPSTSPADGEHRRRGGRGGAGGPARSGS